MGGGRGGVRRNFFGSEILAKRDFLESIHERHLPGFFWVAKKHRDFLGISAQINNNIYTNFTSCGGIFLGYAKKVA